MFSLKSVFIVSLSILTLQSVAQAASMVSPKIEMSFQSRDGHPVEGVTLAGILQYEALTMEDCSGFICVPSLPKYKSTSNAAEMLGETDANGSLILASREFETSSLTARKLQLLVFTNGLITDVCKDGNKNSQDLLNVLPQYMNGQPVPRNPECQTLTVQKGEAQDVQILCYSAYSHSEIEEMKAQIKANCAP